MGRRSGTSSLIMFVYIAFFLGAWAISSWTLMLFVGNLYHAGFSVPLVGFNEVWWAISPFYAAGAVVGVVKGFVSQ